MSPPTNLRPLLRKTDILLLRLNALLSTPSGIDRTLCTLSYTLTLLHARLSPLLTHRLAALAASIASKASDALLPGETLIATLPAPASIRALSRTTASIKALAGLIADFRIFVRLWGLLGIYAWARSTWASPPADAVLRRITWAQVAVNAAYQFLENGAYLASKGVLVSEGWVGEKGDRRQARWWVWSSRFWAAHVGLEFLRLGYLWRKERRMEEKGVDGEGEKEDKIVREAERELWWRDLVSNAAYGPLTVHWSLEEGCLSESWVGLLGMVAGGVGLRERWKATAAIVQ
ncbi:hypothetical protein H2201_007743 [Coniosporium apollinis]|uniref:Peroxin 11C n=2 Tax=Coniosporium TaxID=2810619 RepID=A0ABQ9NIE9_9PEZI|nr:hypothetical protein H2199_007305 [Cladosporium sp. JES 115]KAJ9658536.1 hypothetical protein H2201_007743 [Coniosporium apollinis]